MTFHSTNVNLDYSQFDNKMRTTFNLMIYYCIVPLYYDAKTSHGSKNKKRLFENYSRCAQILVHLTGYFNIWWSFESWQLNVIRSWRMKIECFAPTMTKKIWGNMCSVLCGSWQRKSTLNFFHSFSYLHVCHRLHKLFCFWTIEFQCH